MKKFLLLFSLVSLLISCKEPIEVDRMILNDEVVAMEVVDLPPPPTEDYQSAYSKSYDSDASYTDMAPPKDAPQTEAKIIKTAYLRFETQDLEQTATMVHEALAKYKGQVQNDQQRNSYNVLNHSLSIRIPSASFDSFIDEISKGVTYFDQKQISATDVTEEYIDTESRIKTKKALEERYLQLLKKANKVSEMLEIEKELSAIREEIESKQARLQYLQSQVSYSTVELSFYKTVAEREEATVSYGSKIGNALKSGFNSLSSFFIGLIQIWPFILIFVIAFILIRRRFRRKKQ